MEQNEAEMKSEERNSDREEEIEPRAHLCENSMGRNEAEMKSEDKSCDREEEIELKVQICENSQNRGPKPKVNISHAMTAVFSFVSTSGKRL